jgi:hypothetical protein
MLCQYRHVFGKEREGVHALRLFDVALVDVAFTILGAYLISKFGNFGFWSTLCALLISGIILHKLFCVKTTLNEILFN